MQPPSHMWGAASGSMQPSGGFGKEESQQGSDMTAPALETHIVLPPVWQNALQIIYSDTSKAHGLPQVWQAAAAQCRHAAESCMDAAGGPGHENVLLEAECSLAMCSAAIKQLLFRPCK